MREQRKKLKFEKKNTKPQFVRKKPSKNRINSILDTTGDDYAKITDYTHSAKFKIRSLHQCNDNMFLEINKPQQIKDERNKNVKELVKKLRNDNPKKSKINEDSRGGKIISMALNAIVKQKENDDRKSVLNGQSKNLTPSRVSPQPSTSHVDFNSPPPETSTLRKADGIIFARPKKTYLDNPNNIPQTPSLRASKQEINFELMDE